MPEVVFKEPIKRTDDNGFEYSAISIEASEWTINAVTSLIDLKVGQKNTIQHWFVPIHNILAIICK